MKKKYFTFLFILISVFCFSQRETEKWYFPGFPGPAIDFSSGAPVYLNNSAIGAGTFESSATISDATGGLLFYVDGNRRIYNRNHLLMPNGNNVFMGNSMTQGSIFVPKPGSATIYYLFHIGAPTVGGLGPFNLYYTEVDLTLNGGLGDVNANKNIQVAASLASCGEKMAVTKHCNGTDYWLLVHNFTGTTFKAYQISAAGINPVPVVSNVGASYVANLPPGDDAIGQMKFSPNGTKVAAALLYQEVVELYDFNKLTGVVSNPINLGNTGANTYGVEFSPDNMKLYSCNADFNGNLNQWDLCAGNAASIIASKQSFSAGGTIRLQGLQIAPDGKIYGANFNAQTLGVVNNPNVLGVGCNYAINGFSIAPSQCNLSLPSFISSYFDKPSTYSNITVATVNTNCLNNTGSATATLCSVFGSAPYTYTWSNNTVDGPTSNLTSSISNLAAGTYHVIVEDATCMKDTIYFTISGAGSSPTTQNVAICTGQSYTLPGGGSASVSGTYNDTLLDINGCDSIITTILAVNASINVSVSSTICSGNTYTLPGGTIVNSSGTYIDTVLASGGCDSIITTNLVVTPALTGSLNPTICSGNSYTLPGGAIVTTAGTYIDTVAGTGGCDSIITTTLVISPPLTGNQNPSICTGASYTLPGGTIVTTAGTYIDTVAGIGGCDSVVTTVLAVVSSINVNQNPIICAGNNFTLPGGTVVNTAGTYLDTLTSSGGCDSIITTTLIVNPNATSTQSATICSNQNFTLPDGTVVNTSGTYTSTLNAANGCDSIITTTLLVTASPNATVSSNITIALGSSTTLTAAGGGTYTWSPTTGLDNNNSATVIATPAVTTTYCVYVESNGCIDTACVTVTVEIPCPKPENLAVPNAFSPNADGVNDEFCLQGWENCIEDFSITIFDRWGEKVFESKDQSFCWDGKHKGSIMDAQVFVYYLRAKFQNINSVVKKSGNISLIR